MGSGGALTPKSPAAVSAGFGAIGVVVSPDGRSVYVAAEGPGAVLQFDVGSGGALTPKSPAAVSPGAGGVWLAVSPDGKSLYVTSGSVFQYEVGAGGALTPASPPTVPAGVTLEGIAVTPLPRVPTSKEQCKNGGWRNFSSFNNQGDCVSFVATNGKNEPGKNLPYAK